MGSYITEVRMNGDNKNVCGNSKNMKRSQKCDLRPKRHRRFDSLLETGRHGRFLSRRAAGLNGVFELYQTGRRTLGRFKWEEAGTRDSLQVLLKWFRNDV